jgi:hypothetical protein
VSLRSRADAARAPVREVGPVAAETLEAQSVSPEDGDAEAKGQLERSAAPEAEDEGEPDDETLDDAAFIDEREQGAADVTDIIGDDIDIKEGD